MREILRANMSFPDRLRTAPIRLTRVSSPLTLLLPALALSLPAAVFLLLRIRARRLLRKAGAAYDAERWRECLAMYRGYLLLAARTLRPEARKEILRRMAYAALTGDLNTDLRPVIVEFMLLDSLAPRRRTERGAHEKYYAARGRMYAALRALDFSPRGPESAPAEKICLD